MASAQVVRVSLASTDGGLRTEVNPPGPIDMGAQVVRSVDVTCTSGLDCTNLRAYLARDGQQVGSALAREGSGHPFTFGIRAALLSNYGQLDLVLSLDNRTATVAAVTLDVRGSQPRTPASRPTADSLLSISCTQFSSVVTYVRDANAATFVVTPIGNVLARPPYVDENDSVAVVVTAAKGLLGGLIVRRKSAFRQPGTFNIVGAAVVGQAAGLVHEQAAGEESTCGEQRFLLSNFSGGKGEVELALRTANGESTLGTFEFEVHTLYQGAFGFGFVATTLLDPTFGLAYNGRDSVITETQDGTHVKGSNSRLMYAIFYVPFLRSVDVELGHTVLAPCVGLGLSNVSESAFVGLALGDFRSVFIVVGAHLGHVRRLDPTSRLSVGDPFTAPQSAIPTERHWHAGVFVSATLDVRAGISLLRAALAKQ